MRKTLFTLILTVLLGCTALAQIIPAGKYVGYEPMVVFKDDTTAPFPGIYYVKQSDPSKGLYHSQVWFHEVTVNVISDKKISIRKVPVYFKNGVKFYPDSTGGFFYYDKLSVGLYSNYAPDTSIRGKPHIFGFLTKSKYALKTGDAVPRYTMINYTIKTADQAHLLMETTSGILEYKKQ